jgi:AcrR family transcriptional regulator
MADEAGLPRLTLAALADRLGVRYPSLYKHVDGLDGLQRSIAVRAKNELAATLARATVGRPRGDAIASMSHAYRNWALQHPRPLRRRTAGPCPRRHRGRSRRLGLGTDHR